MAKITLKLNSKDLEKLYKNAAKIEAELTSTEGPIYSYMLTIGNEYKEAVLSGIGKTFDGVLTLKSFLGEPQTVNWKKNAKATLALKKKNYWSLTIWKASGAVERAVKVAEIKSTNSKEIFSGLDKADDPEAYSHAINTEFGAVSVPGDREYKGRALFTLLNAVFSSSTPKIVANIEKQLKEIINKHWGS